MYKERNTRTNLPAEIEILAATDDHGDKPAGHEYRLLFVAKGGGSANKSYFFSSHAIAPCVRMHFCPSWKKRFCKSARRLVRPYHLSVVVGGPSAEYCLRTVKLASTRLLDSPAHHRRRVRPRLSRLGKRSPSARSQPQKWSRSPVRRTLFLPRPAGHTPAPPWCQPAHCHRGFLLGGPPSPRQDQPRWAVLRKAGTRPRPLSARNRQGFDPRRRSRGNSI